MSSASTRYTEALAPERLADRLAAGRLPLLQALRCAADLASELRDLHASKGLHGSVSPALVALEPRRAVLMPAPGAVAAATPVGDVRAFGAILYEMLVGRKPERDAFETVTLRPLYHAAWTDVYQSALGIAEKCMAVTPASIPNLQNVASELRLLLLIAHRAPAAPPPGPAAAPAGADQNDGRIDPEEDLENVSDWDEDAGEWDDRTGLVCPCCATKDVRRSRLHSPLERLLGSLGIPFYRCHRCFHRYIEVLGIRVTMVNPF